MTTKEPPDREELEAKVRELANGPRDRSAVEARLRTLASDGIPVTERGAADIVARKKEILDQVQKRAEEYEQVSQSCAKATALALMEAFGLGHIQVVTALSSFPGVALTGETCGAVSGGMAALSLYFGSDDLLDYQANARAYGKCRKFIQLFEQELGTTKCRDIHTQVIFGRYYETADSKEGYPAFVADKGFEKCGLPPGKAARIAARIILEQMEKEMA
jgi:C_GCAxxG_C_C family probable redox protein